MMTRISVGCRRWMCLAAFATGLAPVLAAAAGGRPDGETGVCTPITLPLERHAADLTVPVDVLGRTVQFALDTGATDSYMLREGRALFDLPPARDPPGWAVDDINGWRSQTEFVTVASIRLGDVERGPRTMPVMDLGYPADAEPRQSEMGLLGNDLLRGYDLDLDASGGRLILYPITAPCAVPSPAWAAAATSVPLRLSAGDNPVVSLSVDGRVIEATFDTGSDRTLIKDPSRGPDGALHRLDLLGPARPGTSIARDVRLAIGDVSESGFPVRAVPADGAVGGRSTLGMDFIGRRRFWLSRRTRRVYISRSSVR